MKPMKTAFVLFVLILVAGLIIPPVSADWKNTTKPSVAEWTDLVSNVTGSWNWTNTTQTTLEAEIASNRSQILAATLINTTAATNTAILASSANISALSGNGTVVMNNGTAVPWYNLTTSYSQILASPQSLNFTTPSAGTYLITANLRENTTTTAPTLTVFNEYALCDANGTTIVANSERMGSRVQDVNNFSAVARSFSWIYTNSTGSTEVGICGKISAAVAGRYAVVSDGDGRSAITYVRLP